MRPKIKKCSNRRKVEREGLEKRRIALQWPAVPPKSDKETSARNKKRTIQKNLKSFLKNRPLSTKMITITNHKKSRSSLVRRPKNKRSIKSRKSIRKSIKSTSVSRKMMVRVTKGWWTCLLNLSSLIGPKSGKSKTRKRRKK